MSSITFRGVTKRYGDVTAVSDLDLEIADNEFMVLLGPSGCGKTTALRMIAGLESITEGELSIGDRVVNNVEPQNRDIAMVFQSYALYPHMTVRRNIESPLRADRSKRLSKGDRDARVAEAAGILGLEDYLDRKPAALSGGQRQRVALGRAIVRRPQAFLMDEPLSNLDAKLRTQTRAELVQLHTDLATTFVYVTHDQVEAMTMATRVAIMNDGRLQQAGTPREVYEDPANLFVARFIGSPPMNTIDGQVVVAQDGTTGVVAGDQLIPSTNAPAGSAGRKVVAGIRPEHLVPHPDGTITGKVTGTEWLGHERQLLSHVPIGDSNSVQVISRADPDGDDPRPGEQMRFAVDPDRVHLFDADSGARMRRTDS